MTLIEKLINHLSDGEFHSGEQLGKTFGLTRSGIWKIVKQFKTWGIEIDSITNKGYRIPGGLELLDPEKIRALIEPAQQVKLNNLEIFNTITSTNDYLLNHSSEKKEETIACFAERQTQGKGRRGRAWISPFAKNIYLSLLWHFPSDPSTLSGLSLAVALAVVSALKEYGVTKHIRVKWPNDVLWKNQKLAGILIELSCEAHNTCRTVIGIGINLDMSSFSGDEISQPWIDIKTILQDIQQEQAISSKMSTDNVCKATSINRNTFAGTLLNELIKTVILFQNEGLTPLIPLWQTLDITFGKIITIQTPTTVITGISRGIDAHGHFLLENSNGEIKSYSSGEISIMKESLK